mmetsp:Transcript_28440/g.80352  ORF Transcript_28440/g.80352 Transcript_28440/m.80352 type:complete len:203 (+) Transcript_28440:1333-1941(+)
MRFREERWISAVTSPRSSRIPWKSFIESVTASKASFTRLPKPVSFDADRPLSTSRWTIWTCRPTRNCANVASSCLSPALLHADWASLMDWTAESSAPFSRYTSAWTLSACASPPAFPRTCRIFRAVLVLFTASVAPEDLIPFWYVASAIIAYASPSLSSIPLRSCTASLPDSSAARGPRTESRRSATARRASTSSLCHPAFR